MRKKVLAIILCFVTLFCATACTSRQIPSDTGGVDESKTTVLRVSNYAGGYGSDWLTAVKTRFEEEYKNTSFEDGKTGVYVAVEDVKINGDQLISTSILDSDTDIFFSECIDYDSFIARGFALNITDYVKETLPGESKSILDKFSDNQKTNLARNGKYYMVPHYAGFNGITIDEDLFNDKKLFMDQSGNFNKKSTDSGLSTGPDGKAGTYDDGLPATLDDFYNLMKTMTQRSITPFIWSADYPAYVTKMQESYAADINGATNTAIGYSFNGTLDNAVASFSADGKPTTERLDITTKNGYDIVKQEGYYYSLELVKKIIDGGYYDEDYCFNGGTQYETQKRFLQSNTSIATSSGKKPIAMMIEGCWWESEATATFTSMEQQNTAEKKYGKKDRNFRFIPFPKATTEKVGTGITLLDNLRAYSFINANLEKNESMKKLAVLFLKYCNTDVSLREFTKITSTVKSLDYTMDEDSLKECTTLCKSLLDMKNAEGTTIANQVSDSLLFRSTVSNHTNGRRYQTDKGVDPVSVFKNNKDYTAQDYFNGMLSYLKADWATKYKAYISD